MNPKRLATFSRRWFILWSQSRRCLVYIPWNLSERVARVPTCFCPETSSRIWRSLRTCTIDPTIVEITLTVVRQLEETVTNVDEKWRRKSNMTIQNNTLHQLNLIHVQDRDCGGSPRFYETHQWVCAKRACCTWGEQQQQHTSHNSLWTTMWLEYLTWRV